MIQLRSALDVFTLVMLIVTIVLLIYTMSVMLMQRGKGKTPTNPKVVTKVRCVQNDYSVERDFSKGDYVGLEIGKCPKCGDTLKVEAIYAVGGPKEKEQPL